MRFAVLTVVLCSLWLMLGCTACSTRDRSPEEIRERAAQATETAAENSKAIAQGIKEGLQRSRMVDINSATKDELKKLPGVTDEKANRIIASRPYANTDQLVTKRVLTQDEFDKVSGRVTVKK
ncbi:MAG TPA: helix-hairpin-helix domain-containing protein [Terriglobales bacterium]|nr:helix-hairpin-helix domain-containing protein [Terriglobales bacterium]